MASMRRGGGRMKIEKPGFYRTRDGQKAEVAAIHKSTLVHFCCVGWLSTAATSWTRDGMCHPTIQSPSDLISEWTDPAPWDWSTTPPWINYLALDSIGSWYLYSSKPTITSNSTSWRNGGLSCYIIPESHAPKWSGYWSESLTERPGYKEAK